MSKKVVNFCYRTIRINNIYVLRSRVQPFWLLRDGTLRPTGYARDAMAFVETTRDHTQLECNGYPSVVLLRPGVNCIEAGDELHITMPCWNAETRGL